MRPARSAGQSLDKKLKIVRKAKSVFHSLCTGAGRGWLTKQPKTKPKKNAGLFVFCCPSLRSVRSAFPPFRLRLRSLNNRLAKQAWHLRATAVAYRVETLHSQNSTTNNKKQTFCFLFRSALSRFRRCALCALAVAQERAHSRPRKKNGENSFALHSTKNKTRALYSAQPAFFLGAFVCVPCGTHTKGFRLFCQTTAPRPCA